MTMKTLISLAVIVAAVAIIALALTGCGAAGKHPIWAQDAWERGEAVGNP